MAIPEIKIDLFPQQSLALQCPAEEVCYGGAAGGGKSHLIRSAMIAWAEAVPGLQLFLFRRLYPDLVRNHMEGPSSFPALLAPAVNAGQTQIVKGEIRFSNGSMIHLRHLQHEKDVYSYQGTEIHVLVFDEATHFSEAAYRYLRGRCRMVGIKVPPGTPWTFPRVLLCTNPGGTGHHWVKRGWIDHGPFVVHRASKAEGGMRRCFIPAKMADNPALMEADPDYVDRLEGLGDPDLVRAMKEGDWDVVAGAMFAQTWRRTKHVIRPFPIPVDWPIWIGVDDGFTAPAASVWLTQHPSTKRYYATRELYRAGMLPAQFAERLKAIQGGIPIAWAPERIEPCDAPPEGLMDAAAFAETGQEEIPRGKQLRKLGIKVQPVEKWPGSRVAGCQNLHRLLAPLMVQRGGKAVPLDGLPGLQIFETCTNLIRTLPTLPRDENNPEDVDTDSEDHLYDALRYGLQWKKTRVTRAAVKGT